MATHSSILAWRIPGTGKPGELPSAPLLLVDTSQGMSMFQLPEADLEPGGGAVVGRGLVLHPSLPGRGSETADTPNIRGTQGKAAIRQRSQEGYHMLKDPNFWYALEKNPMPGHLFEGNPVDEGTTRRGTVSPFNCQYQLSIPL